MDRDHQERVISAHFQSNPGAATFVFTACSAALGFTRSPSSAHSQDLFLLTIFTNHLVLITFKLTLSKKKKKKNGRVIFGNK